MPILCCETVSYAPLVCVAKLRICAVLKLSLSHKTAYSLQKAAASILMLVGGSSLMTSEFEPPAFNEPVRSASEEQKYVRMLGIQAVTASKFVESANENHGTGLIPRLAHSQEPLKFQSANENHGTGLIQRGLVMGEAGDGLLVFESPVDADVSDPFRPPEGPYGPGNRGIEYHTDVGDTVRASAAGEVSFAGLVAKELYVTLDHGGGVFSSYSYLSRISVTQGQRVSQGGVIGLAGERLLHFGVRVNGEYVDPMTFVAERRVSVRLIPNDPLPAK
ncbi:MAG: M23 family metallopeptidase [Acidimicrobiaceae bacterium]|nr:M23 family metallopeptidase [Acidimicrobiaceae bacterium]